MFVSSGVSHNYFSGQFGFVVFLKIFLGYQNVNIRLLLYRPVRENLRASKIKRLI